MVSVPSDESLRTAVSRMAEGHVDALEAFTSLAGPWLLGALRQGCETSAEAEQLLKAVLIEVWRTAPLYDLHFGPPLTWALSLARERASTSVGRRAGGDELEPLDGPESGRAARLASLPAPDRAALLAVWRGDRLDLPGTPAQRDPAARALHALASQAD